MPEGKKDRIAAIQKAKPHKVHPSWVICDHPDGLVRPGCIWVGIPAKPKPKKKAPEPKPETMPKPKEE